MCLDMSGPSDSKKYYVYWIQSANRAYIGATVDPKKRLRQHNGEIAGGAMRTRNRGPWHFECIVSGFRTWQEALQYEWAAKYHSRGCRSVTTRRAAIEALNRRERWTSNSPPAAEVPLHLSYKPDTFGGPPATYAPQTVSSKRRAAAPRGGGGKRRFKKKLLSVTY